MLDLLAREDSLTVQTETGARGRRGERLIYTLTPKGQTRFQQLLEEQVRTYEISHTGMEVAIVFLTYLPLEQAISLLHERYQTILSRRAAVEAELLQMRSRSPDHRVPPERLTANRLAADHLFLLIDAELIWTQRVLTQLRAHGWQEVPMRPAAPTTE